MNANWQNFLTTQGAQIQDGVVQHFGDAAAERIATRDGTVLCDLSQFGVLKVSGEEAQGFLHNLFSCDVNALTPQHALPGSFNTAKGRALATFLIWRNPAEFFLHLPQSLLAAIQKKLTMYVLRAKVKIANASDDIVCLGLSGADAATLLQQHFPTLPQAPLDAVPHEDSIVIRLAADRFQISTTPQQAQSLWQKLSATARPVGSPRWDWLNIRAGIPVILLQTQEAFVPQMANLDLIGAVNFKKGCYPGQEIVARMQYLGKNKRRMYLAHVDGDTAPQPGAELFSMEMEGQSCGLVANAAAAPGGGYDVLAVVQIASHDAFPVHLGAISGARLQFQPLPYPIP
ncbi:MAG: folate-binding protein YgfZ [Gammaproteobacteria bacterium]|nr:folate-binding protein YgfZ [Gammaproteobacteria bacterium]MBU1777210.1 folate-binding protein YgfZ [Gammaproteobacteria bacterium]MBU1969189.1 folate-binding protein YgfZ [Gammaproteobacteria bacterium]